MQRGQSLAFISPNNTTNACIIDELRVVEEVCVGVGRVLTTLAYTRGARGDWLGQTGPNPRDR